MHLVCIIVLYLKLFVIVVTMTYTISDIKTQYFQNKILSYVHSQPTCTMLHTIIDKLKANVSLVSTILGGGDHSHLDLILTPTSYTNPNPTSALYPSITFWTPVLLSHLHTTLLHISKSCMTFRRNSIKHSSFCFYPQIFMGYPPIKNTSSI